MKLTDRRIGSWRERLAPALVVLSGLIQFTGVGVSVIAFRTAGAAAVSWDRVAGAGLLLLLWRRCLFRSPDGSIDWHRYRTVVPFGIAIGGMNLLFYLALDRIPMGSTVAIEYLGPIALAVVTGRGWRTRAGIVAALLGVYLISWGGLDIGSHSVRVGILLALGSAAFWALYVIFSNRALRLGKRHR